MRRIKYLKWPVIAKALVGMTDPVSFKPARLKDTAYTAL
jgi:hypothetical protein